LGQQLSMTPQLQQAIRLLQLSTLELKQEIQEALDSNLVLENEEEGNEGGEITADEGVASDQFNDESREIGEPSDNIPEELPVDSKWEDQFDIPSSGGPVESDDGDYLAQLTCNETLRDYLRWQMNLTPFSGLDIDIATAIIDAIEPDGYLGATLDELVAAIGHPEVQEEEVLAVLHRIQQFDPPGVGARDVRECLLLQLAQLPESTPFRHTAMRIVGEEFDLLASANLAALRRRLDLEESELLAAIKLLRSLNPHPGSHIAGKDGDYIEPDVIVHRKEGCWVVELNPETAPRLRINPFYAGLVKRADDSTSNQTLRNHLQEARWLIKSLRSRNETVLRVATKLVELQREFLERGDEGMRPLVLREVAEALDMHESTVSRVTSHKYMLTPRGTFEFKHFFSSHVGTSSGGEASATAIRARIRKLIATEQPGKPLSDSKIANLLSREGIMVARRTVAKYRESMAIPSSSERKRLM
jgi:RNA polymerase sigma-54 factor